jgi:hypothetical protein
VRLLAETGKSDLAAVVVVAVVNGGICEEGGSDGD